MSQLLGLTTTTDLANHASANVRRKVFYRFPGGSAPMTGLLSMMDDVQPTDKAEWGWYEQDDTEMRVVLGRISGEGPFSDEDSDTAFTTEALVNTTIYRVRTVTDGTNILKVNNTVMIRSVPVSGGGTVDLFGTITEITATNKFEFRLLKGGGVTIDNQAAAWPSDLNIGATNIGYAALEGSYSGTSLYELPELSTNYTQIFKTSWDSTGTSLQEGMKWDETGHYRTKSWQAARQHMKEIEHAMLFGFKSLTQVADPTDGRTKPQRTTQGVYNFIAAWDTAANATLDSDPNKRVINNTSGTMSYRDYNRYLDRLFEVTNDVNHVKLCLCGSGHLTTLNELWENRVTVNTKMLGDDKMEFAVAEVTTPAGTVLYHTHPLMTKSPDFKYSGIYLDMNNLKLVPMNSRDTILQPNIQPNNADYREDQFLTEAGIEVHHTNSHMVIHNLREAS